MPPMTLYPSCLVCHARPRSPNHPWCDQCLAAGPPPDLHWRGAIPATVAGFPTRLCPACQQVHPGWTVTSDGGWQCVACNWQATT
jgi:hypothetical protein